MAKINTDLNTNVQLENAPTPEAVSVGSGAQIVGKSGFDQLADTLASINPAIKALADKRFKEQNEQKANEGAAKINGMTLDEAKLAHKNGFPDIYNGWARFGAYKQYANNSADKFIQDFKQDYLSKRNTTGYNWQDHYSQNSEQYLADKGDDEFFASAYNESTAKLRTWLNTKEFERQQDNLVTKIRQNTSYDLQALPHKVEEELEIAFYEDELLEEGDGMGMNVKDYAERKQKYFAENSEKMFEKLYYDVKNNKNPALDNVDFDQILIQEAKTHALIDGRFANSYIKFLTQNKPDGTPSTLNNPNLAPQVREILGSLKDSSNLVNYAVNWSQGNVAGYSKTDRKKFDNQLFDKEVAARTSAGDTPADAFLNTVVSLEMGMKLNEPIGRIEDLLSKPLSPYTTEDSKLALEVYARLDQSGLTGIYFKENDKSKYDFFIANAMVQSGMDYRDVIREIGTKKYLTSEIITLNAEDRKELQGYAVNSAYAPNQELTQMVGEYFKSKKSLTRILPTKSINVRGLDRIVVTSGRFKGYFIDDLVNKAGRMIEGTSHYIDDNGNRVSIENVDAQGRFILGKDYQDTGLEENYITLGRDGDLVLGMPKLRKTSKTTLNKALLAVGVDPKKFQPVDKINKDGEYYRSVPRQKKGESYEAYQERKANLPEALSLQQIMAYVRDLESKDSLSKEEQDALLAFTDYLDFTAESLKRRSVQKLLKTLYPVKPNGQMYPPKMKWDANRKKLVSVKGTSSTALWKIKAEDFEAVQTILGGIAMSKGASDQVFEHYENQLKKDYALKADNVENYSTAEIGGFISDFAGKPFNFNNKQQEGIAWLAVSGYKGVMALDTGVGKTMVAIGSAQNMLKEDYAQGTNGRFLYVCPEALVGNITQDIAKFMTEDAGQDLNSRFDQYSYKDFAKFRSEDSSWGQDYIAIYFDEAHYLKGSGKLPVAAATLKHPRKIMLTASAIDKDPNDLFQITAITNNIDPKSPEFRAKKRAFSRRFAQEVGGRFVGIKNDPDVKRQFHQWVKSNAFFAPKTQVDYTQVGLPPLPELSRSSETVAMDPKVAKEYEMLAATVQKELRAAISRYRDNDIGGTEMQKIKDFAKNKNLRGALKRLSLLSIEPDKVIKGAKNPKLKRAVSLGKQKIAEGKRVLYWTDNNNVAKKNVENLSRRGASSYIHVLGLKTSIQFWQDGKKIKSITSRTKVDAPLGLWAGAEGINKQLKSFEGRLEYSEDNTLLENDSNRKLIKGIDKLRDELERVQSLEKRLKRRRKTQQRLKTASGNEWAVVALKKFVKNNPLVASVTLTSNYTTGVNLQGFKTVIHLDRNAFSSESMKQRTARTWRAGAKDPVEEITLDAVVPQEQQADEGGIGMSFDQIRELIQQADEKFIDEIISTTQDTEFSEAYKSMEQENTKSLATSRRLVEMMLDPTPQNVGVTTREITDAEKNPVKYVTPRPDRFDNVQIDVDDPEDVRAAITEAFGSEVSIEDIIDTTGFSTVKEIDTIKVRAAPRQNGLNRSLSGSISVSVSGFGGKLKMERTIGKSSIYNGYFKVDECLPKGIAVRAMALQVSAAKKLGIKSLRCRAVGGYDRVGYKVWPKFGYDGRISDESPAHLRDLFEQMPELMDRIMKVRGYTSRDSVTVRDLYLYPRSRDWWEKKGESFNATLKLEGESFDIFQKYISRKVRRSGENLEGYINNAPPPPDFDETNPECFPEDEGQRRTASSLNRLVDRYVNKKAQLEEDEGGGNEAPRLDNEDEEIFAEVFDLLAKELDTAQEKKDLDQKLQEVG